MISSLNKYLIAAFLLTSALAWSQNDTIRLINNDMLVGEVKSISTAVLVIETTYSDKDFRIEFDKVKSLSIERKSIIILTNGRRRFGNIKTDAKGEVEITAEDGSIEHFKLVEIVGLIEVDENFWLRFRGSIDLGLTLAKANKDTQFTVDGEIKYNDEKWMSQLRINVLNSTSENAPKTQRTDANISLTRILPRQWYFLGDFSFLSNTEQALSGRSSPSAGLGKFLASTHKLYLGVTLGFAYTIEEYIDKSLNKNSPELFLYSDFDMFNYDDIDLSSDVKFYYSLSENGRFRTDFNLTLKYDLPYDFYIKLGLSLNYDNQPAIDGSDLDYVLSSGFGWEFN